MNDEIREPPPRHAPEKVARARAFVETLLQKMGGEVAVEVKEGPEAIAVALTGRPGNALELNAPLVESIQTLANRVVNPMAEPRKWVNVEVGGFGEDGDPAMKAMAQRLAEAVRRSGQAMAISPMSARERRQVHLALAEAAGISTRSAGEGIFRELVVLPDPAKKAGA